MHWGNQNSKYYLLKGNRVVYKMRVLGHFAPGYFGLEGISLFCPNPSWGVLGLEVLEHIDTWRLDIVSLIWFLRQNMSKYILKIISDNSTQKDLLYFKIC